MFERKPKDNGTTAGVVVGAAALLLAPMMIPAVRRAAKSVASRGRSAYDRVVTSVAGLGDALSDLVSKVRRVRGRPQTVRLRVGTPHRKRASKRRKGSNRERAR
jgi:hypothetical protein